MNLVCKVRVGQLFLDPHVLMKAPGCTQFGGQHLHLRDSDWEAGFSPSVTSNIYQHPCMEEGGEKIMGNYHPGDYWIFSVLSQILLETNNTNEDLWGKKMLGLRFAVPLLSETCVSKYMPSYLPLEFKSPNCLFYLELISTKFRLTNASRTV